MHTACPDRTTNHAFAQADEWQLGQLLPFRSAIERSVKSGFSKGAWSGLIFGGTVTAMHYSIVKLCPACHQARLRAEARAQAKALAAACDGDVFGGMPC